MHVLCIMLLKTSGIKYSMLRLGYCLPHPKYLATRLIARDFVVTKQRK